MRLLILGTGGMATSHAAAFAAIPGVSLAAAVDVDQDIPADHYKAVAEIIGFVMRLKHGQSWKAKG